MDGALMLAVQLCEWGSGPEFREVPNPIPAGEELLVRVDAAGLCRSDLHVMDSGTEVFDYRLPMTLGHEVAGTVVSAGPSADSSWIGRAVVVHGIWSCGTCPNCLRGRENYCRSLVRRPDGRLAPIGNGLGYPGGLAELMLVPSERALVPTGTLDPCSAAPLADAALTAYHAIRTNSTVIDSRSVVVVVGVGGLGHLALQILRTMDVPHIIAIDSKAEAAAVAESSGAHEFYDSVSAAAQRLTTLGGADLVLDFVGAPTTTAPAASQLRNGGSLVVVGSAGGRLTAGKDVGLAAGWTVDAPFWGTRADLEAVVALAQDGLLRAEITTFPFTEAISAYDRLRNGSVTGRAVLDMSASRTRKESHQ
ncbi:dehydrogenase [Rhodococcus sp. Leaf278]|nr:NAD(P)-dependent alcohol dehydrogenase [Rhodococcus sp. Leaf278]KQU44224.1 dehydrogenase [Rhodococcus sp. Leaf278]